uniref:Helitron_like_N domain-containing protein n=1 Tax=Strongyloides venezuelensis TaxID=75913 RepID=A0A0K0FJV8_STRVS
MNIAITSLINKSPFNTDSIILWKTVNERNVVKEVYLGAHYELLRNTLKNTYSAAYDNIRTDNSVVLRFLYFGTPSLLRIYDNPALRGMLSNSSFMQIHCNVFAFHSLATKAVTCVESKANRFFRPETLQLIDDLRKEPWSQELYSKVTIVMILQVRCLLAAYMCLPEGWIQSNKAL